MLLGEEQGAVGQRCSTFSSRELIFRSWTLVFQIVKDISLAVCCGKFWSTSEIDSACDFASLSIDSCRAVAAAVKCEDAVGGGIIDDRIRFLPGGDFCDWLQSLQVKDGDGRRLTVADESAAELGSDGDAMDARSFGDSADEAKRVDVHYFDLCSVRNIKPAGRRIDSEIVPTAGARDRNLFDDGVAAVLGSGKSNATQDNDDNKAENASSHLISSRPTAYGVRLKFA